MAYDLLNEIRRSIALERLQGLADAGLSVYSSGLAELGGGLAYLPAAAIGGDEAGQYVKQATQDALTYQPRTEAGQGYMQALGKLMQPVADVSSTAGESFANALYKDTGSPLVGALATAAPTALAEMAGRFGNLPKAPDLMDITAYHGSPHDFDEFSMSKIGTGEGAQAYGHGLYFAESPEVAKEYQRATTKDAFKTSYGLFYPETLEHLNVKATIRRDGLDRAIDIARKYAEPDPDYPETAAKAARDLARLEEIKRAGGISENAGRLYTVDIPDEAIAKFLDWDKPLSEQPQAVRDALSETYADIVRNNMQGEDYLQGGKWIRTADIPGQNVVGHLLQKHGGDKKAVSDFLYSLGIPGIRYLDQGSRQGGKGTSNFVVFDDKLIKILKKE